MLRLKELRDKKAVSQDEVAKFLGITQQAYANYERGARKPDPDTIVKLAEYFNVTTDYLLERPIKKGIKIPVLGDVAAGIPIEAIEDIIDYEEIDEETAKKANFSGCE